MGTKYCDQRVCMSVLSVCSHISKRSKFHEILYILPVAVARSFFNGNAIGDVRNLLLVLWIGVMFQYKLTETNRPESSTTLCFVKFARWQHWWRNWRAKLQAGFTFYV